MTLENVLHLGFAFLVLLLNVIVAVAVVFFVQRIKPSAPDRARRAEAPVGLLGSGDGVLRFVNGLRVRVSPYERETEDYVRRETHVRVHLERSVAMSVTDWLPGPKPRGLSIPILSGLLARLPRLSAGPLDHFIPADPEIGAIVERLGAAGWGLALSDRHLTAAQHEGAPTDGVVDALAALASRLHEARARRGPLEHDRDLAQRMARVVSALDLSLEPAPPRGVATRDGRTLAYALERPYYGSFGQRADVTYVSASRRHDELWALLSRSPGAIETAASEGGCPLKTPTFDYGWVWEEAHAARLRHPALEGALAALPDDVAAVWIERASVTLMAHGTCVDPAVIEARFDAATRLARAVEEAQSRAAFR